MSRRTPWILRPTVALLLLPAPVSSAQDHCIDDALEYRNPAAPEDDRCNDDVEDDLLGELQVLSFFFLIFVFYFWFC